MSDLADRVPIAAHTALRLSSRQPRHLRGSLVPDVGRGATDVPPHCCRYEGSAIADTCTEAGCRVGWIDGMPVLWSGGCGAEGYTAPELSLVGIEDLAW